MTPNAWPPLPPEPESQPPTLRSPKAVAEAPVPRPSGLRRRAWSPGEYRLVTRHRSDTDEGTPAMPLVLASSG
jgi:hypothetical protein